MKKLNYQVGALKRKFKTGRLDVEPGTFISKMNEQKASSVKEAMKNPTERTAFMGMV